MRHELGMLRQAILVLGLSALLAPGQARSIGGPDCALPPAGAWPTIADDTNYSSTFDSEYVGRWCHSQDEINVMSPALGLEQADWDEGWGWDNVCDLNLPLSRLLNAAYLVRVVENSATRFGLGRAVPGIPDAAYQTQFWSFAGGHSEHEWEPTCDWECDGTSCVIARHTCDTDCYCNMHIPGTYFQTAIRRASTIVHETTHEDVGHDGECASGSDSCDVSYGGYNAYTMDLNFLHEAMLTYKLVWGAVVGRLIARSGDQCEYVYEFNDPERRSAENRAANIAAGSFQNLPDYAALLAQVDARVAHDSWSCARCDPSRWTFDPQACEQEACNELLNSTNIEVNTSRRSACNRYNQAIADEVAAGTLTPERTEAHWGEYNSSLVFSALCRAPSASGARSYCDAQQEQAQVASDIDACGWLDNLLSVDMDKIRCIKEWCIDMLQASPGGAADWVANDPVGCLDTLCGDEACGDDRSREQCVFELQLASELGDVAASCDFTGCNQKLANCLFSAYQAGTWAFGMSYPNLCLLHFGHCQMLSRLAGMTLINLEAVYNPGALWESQFEQAHEQSRSPARSFRRFLGATRAAILDADEAQQTRLLSTFTANRELVVQLFRMAPGKFVWLFGREGFRDVLGPQVDSVPMEAIDFADLAPEGRAAFRSFQTEISRLAPGEVVEGDLGTFARR
jgi:hypothetical protein